MYKADYLAQNTAINLKRIRMARKMSLDEVSEQTGVSKSMLGQIERGESNPTLGTMGKIVSGLRVEFEDLIAEPALAAYEIDHTKLVPSKEIPGQYTVYNYFPFEKKRNFEIYVIDVESGGVYYSGPHGEKTAEYVIGIEGTMKLKAGDSEYIVNSQDALFFQSDIEHRYINESAEKAKVISVFSFQSKY
ncbi:helix-turn-helix domain-containing protein [uncultured Clostridium sp.]|uniref:helix-turn-helix domain-containing protein n=1 Tax=uncultured Clostridium sp. TaxID=59620 RepID=UPI0025F58EC1|nr:XRE family transcriptional regulator [uncultured Clostridium sp.]